MLRHLNKPSLYVRFTKKNLCKIKIIIKQDERNVLRDPPAGVDFIFEFESNMPVATAMLECDPKLNDLRFKLVPKVYVQLDLWVEICPPYCSFTQ